MLSVPFNTIYATLQYWEDNSLIINPILPADTFGCSYSKYRLLYVCIINQRLSTQPSIMWSSDASIIKGFLQETLITIPDLSLYAGTFAAYKISHETLWEALLKQYLISAETPITWKI